MNNLFHNSKNGKTVGCKQLLRRLKAAEVRMRALRDLANAIRAAVKQTRSELAQQLRAIIVPDCEPVVDSTAFALVNPRFTSPVYAPRPPNNTFRARSPRRVSAFAERIYVNAGRSTFERICR